MDSFFIDLFHKFIKSATDLGIGLGYGLSEGLGIYTILFLGSISSIVSCIYGEK